MSALGKTSVPVPQVFAACDDLTVTGANFTHVTAVDFGSIPGTSLAVFSGYRFLRRAVERGASVAIVNRGPVRGEEHAAVKIEASVGVTLEALSRALA